MGFFGNGGAFNMWKQKRAKAQANRNQAAKNRLNKMKANRNAAKNALNRHNAMIANMKRRGVFTIANNAKRSGLVSLYMALARSVHLIEKNNPQLRSVNNRRQRN